MDRFTRTLMLHRLLAAAHYPVPRRRIEEILECSPASVKRIIRELRDFLGAPVEYDRKANGYFYAASESAIALPGLWFSAHELFALASVQALLSNLSPGLLDSLLRPVRNRVEQLLGKESLGLAELPRRVRLTGVAGRVPEPCAFQRATAALLQRKRLLGRYHARGSDVRSERILSPQRLVLYRHNWYLDAWCHLRDDLRTFALERLTHVRVLDESAQDVPEPQLDAHFTRSYGLFAGEVVSTAVIRFTSAAARWVAEEVWHPEQRGLWLPYGEYELHLPYSNPTELVMDVLRYGGDAEIVAPEDLRQLAKERLQTALERYA